MAARLGALEDAAVSPDGDGEPIEISIGSTRSEAAGAQWTSRASATVDARAPLARGRPTSSSSST